MAGIHERIKEQFRGDIISFLNQLEDNKAYENYDKLVNIVLQYQLLPKQEVIKIMHDIDNELMDTFSVTQEEIMIEVINSLEGSPFGKTKIKWEEGLG